jgi:hypothetical protein
MLGMGLSARDPDSYIGSITKHDLAEATPRPARVPSSRRAPEAHMLESVMRLWVCKAHLWLTQPSCSPQLRFGAPHENWLVKTSLRQAKARARQRFCWTEKRQCEIL